MIEKIQLLENIGKFHSVSSGQYLPLDRLTLVYADNARGKTTLSAVLRSLATNDPKSIVQRKSFDGSGEPHAIIATSDAPKIRIFKKNRWNADVPKMMVFDDSFVNDNVYSGLSISPKQRQGLHDVILGAKAVRLERKLDEQIQVIKEYASEIAISGKALKPNLPAGFTLEQFCKLDDMCDIDGKIAEAERNVHAARQHELVGKLPAFESLQLPQFDLKTIETLLDETLDTLGKEALEKVEKHIQALGGDGESWISEGMTYIPCRGYRNEPCPFCGQKLSESDLIEHYRIYFSKSYSALKEQISTLTSLLDKKFGHQLNARLLGNINEMGELRQKWNQFLPVELDPPKANEIFGDCKLALDRIQGLLTAKQASPLERVSVAEQDRNALAKYEQHLENLEAFNQQIEEANRQIGSLKAEIASSSLEDLAIKLNVLKAVKVRYSPEIAKQCGKYLSMNTEKSKSEQTKKMIVEELTRYRSEIFPRFGEKVNAMLGKFGTEFEIANLKPINHGSGSTTTYGAKVSETVVDLSRKTNDSEPSFGTVLSAGDRTTLAFSLFMASVGEMDELDDAIVVIDDPISSLDTGRNACTVEVIGSLVGRANQVIVLSHSKSFLCEIASQIPAIHIASIQIQRTAEGSTLKKWDFSEDALTEHDLRDLMLREYVRNGSGNRIQVAQSLRKHLEGYFRVTCPQHLPPSQTLGQFRKRARMALSDTEPILSEEKLTELNGILKYANPFHHSTEPSWKKVEIDDNELRTFAERTLRFTAP